MLDEMSDNEIREFDRTFRSLALLVMLAGCRPDSHLARSTDSASAPLSESATDLPLQRGFYVASDTVCSEASNATLGLLHRQGLNSAREDCTFAEIVALDEERYRITEQCAEIGTGEASRYVVEWQVLSHQSFRRRLDSGWTSQMRYCDQATLPDTWHGIDLEAAIDRR